MYNRQAEKRSWKKFEAIEAENLTLQIEREREDDLDREYMDLDLMEDLYHDYLDPDWDDIYDYDETNTRYDDGGYDEIHEEIDEIELSWSIYDECDRPQGAWGKSFEPTTLEDIFLQAMDKSSK